MAIVKVRPAEAGKEPFHIFMTAARLLDLKLKNGDLCDLDLGDGKPLKSAVAWLTTTAGMKDDVVQISKLLQELYGIKPGHSLTVSKSTSPLREAQIVTLRSIGTPIDPIRKGFWEEYAQIVLPSLNTYLTSSQKVTLSAARLRHEFEVVAVGGAALCKLKTDTKFIISDSSAASGHVIQSSVTLDFGEIGGLENEKARIGEIVQDLVDMGHTNLWPTDDLDQGVLLYGSKGTGKSYFAEAIAKSPGWSSVIRWQPGTAVPKLETPQLLLVDLSNKLPAPIVHDIVQIFRKVRGTPTLVIGECRHPNDVADQLRSLSAFSIELEIPIPDVEQRYNIFKLAVDSFSQGVDDQIVRSAADRTHGYVGSDLEELKRRFRDSYRRRTKTPRRQVVNGLLPATEPNHEDPHLASDPAHRWPPTRPRSRSRSRSPGRTHRPLLQQSPPPATMDDLDDALPRVRPSAMQEVFLDKPKVRWTDIGGQKEVKQELQNAIEWPLKYPDEMKRMGMDATKGVLLYGPPGCSKTLLVKALAAEAGLNFLAVKGAELISMYVGESERATRELFRKARAASPCIIFFDEIDAIASRSSNGGGSRTDLNVLTTLLNEMDGFEELRNVLVVAATNKPMDIDPALMRPGRFDKVVYIGPPDSDTRREILQARLNKHSFDEEVRSRLEDYTTRTVGFSGAEVVGICKTAAEYAFSAHRRSISTADVDRAITSTPKSISRDMLTEYENWNSARMK